MTREPNVATINAHQLNKINTSYYMKKESMYLNVNMYIRHRAKPVFTIDPGSKNCQLRVGVLFSISLFHSKYVRFAFFFSFLFVSIKAWSEAMFSTVFFLLLLSRFLSPFSSSSHFNIFLFCLCLCAPLSAIFVCCCRHFADLIEILSQTLHRRYQLEIIDNYYYFVIMTHCQTCTVTKQTKKKTNNFAFIFDFCTSIKTNKPKSEA